MTRATDYFSSYQKRKRRREVYRWILLIAFFVAVIVYAFLLFYLETWTDFGLGYWCLGSLILVVLMFLTQELLDRKAGKAPLPSFDPPEYPAIEVPHSPTPVRETIWGQLIICWPSVSLMGLFAGGPMTLGIIIGIATRTPTDEFLEFFIPMCCSGTFFPTLIVAGLLYQSAILETRCDQQLLTIGFRWSPPLMIPLTNIHSIRPVAINALREFMGWGRVHGADGSIGYISSGQVGVRIILKSGEQYVVTVKDPQSLVDFVNWWKSVPGPVYPEQPPVEPYRGHS